MSGQLFTNYFLREGIKETQEWRDSKAAFQAFERELRELFRRFRPHFEPNEATTEQELIIPVLRLLGWEHYLPQQSMAGGRDYPDLLLYDNEETRAVAAGGRNPDDRFRDTIVVEESKRAGTNLDARAEEDVEERDDPDGRALPLFGDDESVNASPGQGRQIRRVLRRTPHGQILHYLRQADDRFTDGEIRWGILTDGGVWRLYDYATRPRSTAYFEVDLWQVFREAGGDGRVQTSLFGDDADDSAMRDLVRLFHLLFRRESFTLQRGAAVSFLRSAIEEGARYEQRVAEDLSKVVFADAFPRLVSALAEQAPDTNLTEVQDSALIILYRLLFVLYAEDRGLLPVNDVRYASYSLRKVVRDDVARKKQAGAVFSGQADTYYSALLRLFGLIDSGDNSIGLPAYNGGLFSNRQERGKSILESARLPDNVVADVVYGLSHTVDSNGAPQFVNYRDLSVQQLGSIYERLLEREPARDENGAVIIRPNPYARKDSGSYYTPQELVDLVIDRTLGPLIEERLDAFTAAAKQLEKASGGIVSREEELSRLDPAEAALGLRVLDPAMGSGHFLVSAADYMTDYIADLVEYAPVVPDWPDASYTSPLVGRLEDMRKGILKNAEESNWTLDAAQLTDQALIRRLVLKSCIYGVDKNPMAVELAKVSLWLHSFTVGAPLSFLDHHLRCGDSLLGLRVAEATSQLSDTGRRFARTAIKIAADESSARIHEIEASADIDLEAVRESTGRFRRSERATKNLRGMLDFFCGANWLNADLTKREHATFSERLSEALKTAPEGEYEFLTQPPHKEDPVGPEIRAMWDDSRSVANQERFIHWEAAFPTVWDRWYDPDPQGGFDAVIGNPPWDRIKLQEVEWFATRMPELARAPTAAARKVAIERLRQQESPLVDDFSAAKEHADIFSAVVRSSGHYPLLGQGDINLYSLFVERAMSLVKPDGIVGLLTPSGIYGDRTAADFFEGISTSGRLAGLYDFENKKIFFKDVHASFKFCALIFGGESRRFDKSNAAFFLHDTETVADANSERVIPLTSADFSMMNPNTRTAPIFRTRRDAEITRGIYGRHPTLVDRSGDEERRAWPVRYHRMFDMTNDSHLFRTAAQLQAAGFYPVSGNRWQRGEEYYVPLYEGKMVQAYDHRAASVVVNPANLNRPAQPRETTSAEHAKPDWLPTPQFWVPASECGWDADVKWVVGFKEITAPTNARTFIAALFPAVGFGNKVPILKPETESRDEWLLAANFNAVVFDFVTRQKLQGQTLNLYILEQLPVIAPTDYDRRFGDTTARDLVRDHVLRLTYTAHDMAPFAKDLGYDGSPFVWDEEERRHLRTRLDALYFHLYGLKKEDADYILSTFPIVERNDRKAFGRYRTRDMVLAYMDALAAGDSRTVVSV